METVCPCVFAKLVEVVLRLPMRDGNPLEELRAAIEAIVLRLPMRDGNFASGEVAGL